MDQEFVVPSLGVEINEGVVREWLKHPGDAVAIGDLIVVIGTTKLDMEVESPFAGVLGEAQAHVDDLVSVGDVLAIIRT